MLCQDGARPGGGQRDAASEAGANPTLGSGTGAGQGLGVWDSHGGGDRGMGRAETGRARHLCIMLPVGRTSCPVQPGRVVCGLHTLWRETGICGQSAVSPAPDWLTGLSCSRTPSGAWPDGGPSLLTHHWSPTSGGPRKSPAGPEQELGATRYPLREEGGLCHQRDLRARGMPLPGFLSQPGTGMSDRDVLSQPGTPRNERPGC